MKAKLALVVVAAMTGLSFLGLSSCLLAGELFFGGEKGLMASRVGSFLVITCGVTFTVGVLTLAPLLNRISQPDREQPAIPRTMSLLEVLLLPLAFLLGVADLDARLPGWIGWPLKILVWCAVTVTLVALAALLLFAAVR